jgi:hypothetical protein
LKGIYVKCFVVVFEWARGKQHVCWNALYYLLEECAEREKDEIF